jgi:hypothetical protein
MSLERGLNPAELKRVLRSTRFAQAVAQLAIYTRNTQSEGGFGVYKALDSGKLSISSVLLPSDEEREKWRTDMNEIASIYVHISRDVAKGAFDGTKLMTRRGYEYRRDVGIYIHSHPEGHEFLRPSSTDLELYEHHNGLNLNIICGILTTSEKRARVFFYGQTATHYALGAYQVTNPDYLEANEARQILADDGFCTALVEYRATPSSIGIVSNPDKVVADYFKLP